MEPVNHGQRSRSGCMTCRRKHRKCDEGQPTCQACQIRGLKCDYKTPLRWAVASSVSRLRQDANKSRVAKRRGGAKSPPSSECPSTTLPELSESVYFGQAGPASSTCGILDSSDPNELVSSSSQQPYTAPQPTRPGRDGGFRDILRSDASPLDRFIQRDEHIHSSIHRRPQIIWPQVLEANSNIRRNQDLQPSILQDGHSEWGNEGQSSPDFYETSNHWKSQYSHKYRLEHESGGTRIQTHRDDEKPHDANANPTGSISLMINNTLGNLLFEIFQTPGEEIAFTYFFKRVCTCIPAHDSDRNPWRMLALVSLSHPVLLHGVLSVATAHMYNCGKSNVSLVSSRQSRALQSLQAALDALQANKNLDGSPESSSENILLHGNVFSMLSATEIALAAVMMQTSSVLMTGAGNVEMHLKCALHFIKDLGYLYRPARSMFSRTLVNRFAMVDVVHAHLRFQRPLASLDFFIYQDNEELDHTDPPFREMHGCDQRVLCFLAEIATLSADLLAGKSTQDLVQAKAYKLETEMRVWGQKHHDDLMRDSLSQSTTMTHNTSSPQSPRPPPSDSTNIDPGLDTVCECFYWTAQLLLLRRLFLDPTKSSRVQLVRRRLFQLIDTLEPGCGPDSSLPFPFYVAAREATTLQERDWVRRKHTEMMEVYRDQSREYMMEYTEKIWNNAASVGDYSVDDGSPLWGTPQEKYIRELDKAATYFMF